MTKINVKSIVELSKQTSRQSIIKVSVAVSAGESIRTTNSYINQNPEYFNNIDKETAFVIGELLNSEDILKTAEKIREGESMSMCKALEDLYNEGRLEGRLEVVKGMIDICKEVGFSMEATIAKLAEKLGESEERVKDDVVKYWNK